MLRVAMLAALLLVTAAAADDVDLRDARSETLRRVRIAETDPAALAASLAAAGFDVLEGTVTESTVDVVASAAEMAALERRGLTLEVVARGRPLREALAAQGGGEVPRGYPDPDAVLAAMTSAAAAHPQICALVDLTTTYDLPATAEGRHLYAIKISDNVALDEDEPATLIVSGHHAREIVTPVIALFTIDQLTSLYGTDEAITAAVDENEIWIAPVWNPDGYAYVFETDNLWRKNRRNFEDGTGVDLNRNYPTGWDSKCSGSDVVESNVYKGPEPASEVEVTTMMTLSRDRHFARVIDYHSSGREVLHAYRCWDHPLDVYLEAEATALSTAAGYDGDTRPPSAQGEHYQWQLATTGAHAFLIETHSMFQPEHASAVDEAMTVFPGTLWLTAQPIPVSGHVVDSATGDPVAATITTDQLAYEHGETNTAGGPFGRYHLFLPPGLYDLAFTATGYAAAGAVVRVTAGAGVTLDVALEPRPCHAADVDVDGTVGFTDLLAVLSAWGPCAPGCPEDLDGDGDVGFADLVDVLSFWGPCA